MNMRVTRGRDWAQAILQTHRKEQAGLVAEYIQEAEHQEGLEYWFGFSNQMELLDDFDLYAQAAQDCQEDDDE